MSSNFKRQGRKKGKKVKGKEEEERGRQERQDRKKKRKLQQRGKGCTLSHLPLCSSATQKNTMIGGTEGSKKIMGKKNNDTPDAFCLTFRNMKMVNFSNIGISSFQNASKIN